MLQVLQILGVNTIDVLSYSEPTGKPLDFNNCGGADACSVFSHCSKLEIDMPPSHPFVEKLDEPDLIDEIQNFNEYMSTKPACENKLVQQYCDILVDVTGRPWVI